MQNTKTPHEGLVISAKNLSKSFGATKALNDFDMSVRPGEVHGFLGPNGAGKSTAIRVFLGLLKRNSGDVSVFGKEPWGASEYHGRLAYVPGEVNFWPNLTGGEIIDLIGKLRGNLDEGRRRVLLEKFQLDPKKKFRMYSKGNRQKVALIAALASDVELYILDEPTSGLDPLMEQIFQEEIRYLHQKGRTILLSSHILAEVENLCDTITIIRSGKSVETGDLETIRAKHRTAMTVTSDSVLEGIASIDGVHAYARRGIATSFELETHALPAVISLLGKYKIKSLVSQPPSLEHLFMSHYETDE